ncbi:MAG: hypothetical protein H6707_19195 [Deltaproteobacteria bacterium]|nr:hypothetical protein [Deltaproteobacteria bacterium]
MGLALQSAMITRRISYFSLWLTLVALGTGCAQDGFDPSTDKRDPDQPKFQNTTPSLMAASPSRMSVGDTMTLIGDGFIPAQHGHTVLHFVGTFTDEDGVPHAVDYQVQASQINEGKLRWKFGPNVVFVPTGDKLGRFVGSVSVLNQMNDQSAANATLISDPLSIEVEVKPSLIAEAIYPVGAGCGNMVTKTLGEVPMGFTVRALGLREGTRAAPMTFRWTFDRSQWDIMEGNGTFDPFEKLPKEGSLVVEDVVESGTRSTVADGGERSFLVKAKQDILGQGTLNIKTKKPPEKSSGMPVSVAVSAVDGSGRSASLTLEIKVHDVVQAVWDNKVRIAERFEPEKVSDCIPGGPIGVDVSYTESTHFSRSRSVNLNWNVNAHVPVAPLGILAPHNTWATFGATVNFSLAFGVNVHEEVSTSESKSLAMTGHIHPGEYGAWYRQITRLARIAYLTGHTVCGETYDLGQAVMTDWLFTPDLAKGNSCPPQHQLQPAGVFDITD